MKRWHTALTALTLVLVLGPGASPLRAQQPDTTRQPVGAGAVQPQADSATIRRALDPRRFSGPSSARAMSHAEIIERLRQSGLSRGDARARLRQRGNDPTLLDPYYDVIERGGEPPRGNASPEVLSALRDIGVLGPDEGVAPVDSTVPAPGPSPTDSVDDGLKIFGRALFENATSQFEPVFLGPVGPDYRLGPGDEVILVLTGDVEAVYTIPVSREGFLVIPDVGQVSVNGLTLRQLEDRLYDRLGQVYSGVRRGPDATTHFQVSLGQLGAVRVFVIGDVERPGSYQISSVATVLTALYQAGGPSENGSFRRIQLRRGGRVVRTIDLYDYLLYGDGSSDVRVEQGDVVFIPPVGPQVQVEGAVGRPAIYELVAGDALRDLIGFAGGFDATADLQRIQIDRILPPARRRPGVDRVLIDVDLGALQTDTASVVPLEDGDAVRVFAVSKERRNRVVVTGDVRRPGVYEWSDGLTLWDLIGQAQGLNETAYTQRAHIYRLNEADGSRSLIRTALVRDSAGAAPRDVLLADRDSVVILSRERLRTPRYVAIDGFVKEPGVYPLADGMTIPDLILAAGGFVAGAYTLEAEVARLPADIERTDTTARVIRVPLAGGSAAGAADAPFGFGGRPPGEDGAAVRGWVPQPDEFVLLHGDRVFIRKAPGYELPRTVKITGEVLLPGTYVLETRQEHLTDVIRRAGGLTGEAYVPGLQVIRDGEPVATDLLRALEAPDSRFNLLLEAGDSLHVPTFDPTVRVVGAVAFESQVLYEPGKGLDYYVNRAGGYTELADEDRVTVMYMDGERATVEEHLFVIRSTPEIRPGTTIFVPNKPPTELRGFDPVRLARDLGAISSGLLTLLLLVRELR